MQKFILFAGFVISLSLAGCIKQGSSSVATHQLKAASLGDVAVMPFRGNYGTIFSDRIAYELLRNGATVLTKPATIKRLQKGGFAYTQVGTDNTDIVSLGKMLDVDVLVFGSVYAQAGKASIMETAQGDLSVRASSASIRLVSARDGRVLSVVNFKQGETLGFLKSTYKDVAEQLVSAVLSQDK